MSKREIWSVSGGLKTDYPGLKTGEYFPYEYGNYFYVVEPLDSGDYRFIKGTSKNRFEKRKCVSRVEDKERLRRLADASRGDLTKYSAWMARFLSNGFLEVPLRKYP